MLEKNGVALDWVTLFSLEEKNKKEVIRQIKNFKAGYNPEYLAETLGFDGYGNDKAIVMACEIVVLRFCLADTDFAKDFLSAEDHEKALKQFERKQYTSKLLKELISKFYDVLRRFERRDNNIKTLLKLDIVRTSKIISEELLEKSFSKLKKAMESIASGVKSSCYFAAEKSIADRYRRIKNELNDFLIEKYGYDLNKFNLYFWDNKKSINSIFRFALLDDKDFWNEHSDFNVFKFIDSICEFNDATHAQKVLSHIFDKIKGNEIGAYLIENNLTFVYLYKDAVFSELSGSLLRFFYRFEEIYDLNTIKDEACCYPYAKTDRIEEKIAEGKEIMKGLINSVYPADGERVMGFFNEQLNGREPFVVNGYTVKNLLIGFSSCLWYDHDEIRKAVVGYCRDYFSAENVWSRICLVAFAARKLESNVSKCNANLFEIFYDLFTAVEKKFGLKTAYQKDVDGRDSAYAELKNILKKYGVNITDERKSDYIISLLDRKVAIIEESERFPVLEQLGDAIYGLAVAEMTFYQPAEIEDESIFKKYENYIRAQTQVEIVQAIGIDKLYISPLTLSYKYSTETATDYVDEIFVLRDRIADRDCKFKFLADSLEMVIGTICKDLGYQAAIDFTKRVVKETYPDVFTKEIRWENRDDVDPKQEIDWEYWNRIQPSPFHRYETYSSKGYTADMWGALNKFMLAYCLGTENVEERKFITNRHSGLEYGDELYGKNTLAGFNINYAMYDYLHNGLAYVLEKYSAIIKENYKNINK